MNKILVFDMDGTIVDLYSVHDWLKYLREEKTFPYEVAMPMYDMETMNFVLNILKNMGYKVVVTTWGAKKSSKEFLKATAIQKKKWLDKYGFPYDEMFCVPYGVSKHEVTKEMGGLQILFDDNSKIIKEWNLGYGVNAKIFNILDKLTDIIIAECDRKLGGIKI